MNKPSLYLIAALLLPTVPALAEPVALSERAAAQETIRKNPTVRAAVLDVQQRVEELRAERARYRPTLLLEGNVSRQNTPNLSILGNINTMTADALTLGAELSQTFSWGTKLALRVENRNYRNDGPLFSGQGERFRLGPGHLLGAKLSVTQPLLRGFGQDVGLAELRSAVLNRQEQERARDAAASAALSNALEAYWELWYAQKALEIEREARELAIQERDEMQRKVAAGSAAPVELLTYETRVSELDQSVLDAEVAVATRSVELRKAMGMTESADFDVSFAEPPELEPIDAAAILKAAEESSYEVAQLRITLERAETTARSAADATRPRLDVSGWVQAQGLGNRELAPAFEQVATMSAVSGFVGVELELPLSSQRHKNQLASARTAVTASRERLLAAIQQARAQAQTELTTLGQARNKVALAERTAEVAARSAEAQRKRLANGVATPLEVREAEDSLRRARLSVERQRIDAVKAQIRLAHLTGNLLVKWGADELVDAGG